MFCEIKKRKEKKQVSSVEGYVDLEVPVGPLGR